MPDSEGRRIGRYVIYGELASGGMATVHLGRLVGPVGFSKTVAIKRLHAHLASEPDFVAMLIDEARLVSSINHPNVVGSLDVVYEADELLLVMDYIEGETLARLLVPSRKDTSLNPPGVGIVARVVIDVLSGLHAAHTAKTLGGQPLNIVHRDVSPQNIMVGVDGIARVLDFGIAKAEHRRHVTRPGHVKGKFAYMSPEQIRGQPVDARTDVFAAGVVLWECLAKRRLFRLDGQDSNPDSVLTLPIFPPSHFESAISPALDSVVLRALSRDRNARFASAAEFAEALRAVMEPASPVEVGRWVTQAAKRGIANRSELLQDIETSTINVARSDVPAHLGRRFSATAETVDRPIEHARTVVLEGPVAPAEPARLHGWSLFALFLAAAGAVALLGMTLIAATSKREPLAPNISPLEARSTAQAASTRAAPEEEAPPKLPAPEPLESLPELASPRPAEPRATATASPSPHLPAQKPLLAAPKQTPTAEAPAPKSPEPKPAARSCDPPYRIDAFGIRRVRRECL